MTEFSALLRVPIVVKEILLHLPLRQIVIARRICTVFNGVVLSSSDIHKALFLEPATDDRLQYFQDAEGYGEWKASEAKDDTTVPFLNPFFTFANSDPARSVDEINTLHRGQLVGLYTIPASKHLVKLLFPRHQGEIDLREPPTGTESLSIWRSTSGPWMDMQLAHPPLRKLELMSLFKRAVVEETSGDDVTLRRFINTCVKLAKCTEGCWIHVVGASQWERSEGSADEITGHDVLRRIGVV